MKAVIITHPGGPDVLKLQERSLPEPVGYEVLIEIKAAGVNRPDIFQRKGNYPPPPGAPVDIPGLEVAGVVTKCGNLVNRWKPGDTVCALLAGGGYATETIADSRCCLPLPPGWTFTEACTLPETVFTVWNNVFQRGRLTEGEHLLIHGGSSGIGITATQLAKAFGAKVSVTVGGDEKCLACTSFGADRCINYKIADFEEILKQEGVDVILDMIGGDYVPKNIRLLKPDGRLVFINSIKGPEASFDIPSIMRKRLIITGSMLRSREIEFKSKLVEDVEKNVWPLLENKKFRPFIFTQFKMQDAASAHTLMESNEHIGRIVLVNEP